MDNSHMTTDYSMHRRGLSRHNWLLLLPQFLFTWPSFDFTPVLPRVARKFTLAERGTAILIGRSAGQPRLSKAFQQIKSRFTSPSLQQTTSELW